MHTFKMSKSQHNSASKPLFSVLTDGW